VAVLIDIELPDENARFDVVLEPERRCASPGGVAIARIEFFDELVPAGIDSAGIGYGRGTSRAFGIGIAVLKTVAFILACSVVGIVAVASGIMGLLVLAAFCLFRK
jgi:hypothetical protein